MKVLFDTSVLVASLVDSHPEHGRSLPWLARAKRGEIGFLVSSHTLLELYAVLTGLPLSPRIHPATAWKLVHEGVETSATQVAFTAGEYRETLKSVADLGLPGGVVYDALIARAAQKAGADRLLTLDPGDFRRVWPEGAERIVSP